MEDAFWQSPWPWLIATLLCVMLEGFFSMQEMAIVSLNRLDLLYDYARGSRRAKWISKLLQNPHQLFSTTLLVVNLVLQIGSECSRRFYQSLDLSSGIAPISQVVLVVICAELAPMFAARQYPRQIAFAGIPVLYAVSVLLRPVVSIVAVLAELINKLLGTCAQSFAFVSREDLKSILRRIQPAGGHEHETFLEKVGSNILAMQEVCAGDIARSLSAWPSIDTRASLQELRSIFEKERCEFVLVYDHILTKVTGIALPRTVIDPTSKVMGYVYQIAKPALMVHSNDSLLKVMAPLRQSRHSIAIVLDQSGQAIGCLTFDEVAHYLFGPSHGYVVHNSGALLERRFDIETRLGLLRQQWGVQLDFPDDWTLERLLNHLLEHTPAAGEKCHQRGVEFEVRDNADGKGQVLIRAFVHTPSHTDAEKQPLAQ